MMIEIDYEIEEQIVRQSLRYSLAMMTDEIGALLETEGPLPSHLAEDLQDSLRYHSAIQEAVKYYSIHTDWPEIDAFDVDVEAIRLKLAEIPDEPEDLEEKSDELMIDLGAL